MIARKINNGIEKRLLSAEEAQSYCGIGRFTFRKFADKVGATKRFGTRVLFDKAIIDKALDNGMDLAE